MTQNKKLSIEEIEKKIQLAKEYEYGTEDQTKMVLNPRYDKFNNDSDEYVSEVVSKGITKDLTKSIRLYQEVLESLDIEDRANVEKKIDSLKNQHVEELYKPKVDKLREIYRALLTHYENEVENEDSEQLDSQETQNDSDEQLQDKIRATNEILNVLDSRGSNKAIFEAYQKLHNDKSQNNPIDIIKADRSFGEKMVNEATRVLVSMITLGYKTDFVLFKSHGLKQIEEASTVVPPMKMK